MQYKIDNKERFLEASRVLTYNLFDTNDSIGINGVDFDRDSLSKEEQEELDTILSFRETEIISQDFLKQSKNREGIFLITEKKYLQFLETLNSRMVSNILSVMSSKGLLETAFSEEDNDFVFWVKDDPKDLDKDNEKIQKPETD